MKYILNPIYKLYLDKNRVLLLADADDGGYRCFIHPVYAIILSQFTGEFEIQTVYQQLADIFNKTSVEMEKIVKPFLQNKDVISFKYDGYVFSFPPLLLIKNKQNTIRKDLNLDSYAIKPPYDFETRRLNYPKHAMLIINTKCYTDCAYCYADKEHKYETLPTKRIIEIIKEAKSIGINSFDLSGGEVLLHKDYDLIISELLKQGYKPFISTKVPIESEKIDKLWEIGLRQIQISLESLNPFIQKNNLKVKEDYVPKIIKTIQKLDEKGFEIIIKSTCTKETCTKENIEKLIEFINSLHHIVKYTFTPLGYSHYKSLDWYNENKPNISMINGIYEVIKQNKRKGYELEWDVDSIHYYEEYRNKESFDSRSICTGNLSGFVILPDGKVTICEELYWNKNFIIGDLSKQSILEVWNSPNAKNLWKLQQDNFPEDSACKYCDEFEHCRYIRGVCWKEVIAFYGNKNWLYPDPRCPKAPELNSTNKKLMYEKV